MANLTNKNLFAGLSIITLIYLAVLFKLQGLAFFFGIGIIFMAPICLIIHKLGFNMTERLLFSFFLGIGIFPSLVYYLALAMGSIIMVALIVWAALTVIGVIAHKKLIKFKMQCK